MSTCLFCEHELNASTKPEHVLLNALGGRRKSTRLICSDCNNEFGSTIDAALASQVPAIRNTLQLPSGTGKPPPSLKKVQAGADIVDFRNDGTPELTGAPFRFVPDGDGLRIEIDARSPEHLNSLIPNIASKLGATEAHVRELLLAGSANHISRRPGTIHQRLSFGGEEALRSMTKACLELLALRVGNEVVREQAFAEARAYVKSGDLRFNEHRTSIDTRVLPAEPEIADRFGPAFNLVVVKSDSYGRVIGHYTLYNILGWQMVLAEEGGPPNQFVALASNPIDPSVWSDDLAGEIDVPFEWLSAPTYADVAAASPARMSRILNEAASRNTTRAIHRALGDVFARHGFGPDDPIEDPEVLDAILAEASHAAAHIIAGVPQERVVSQDEIATWLGTSERRDD